MSMNVYIRKADSWPTTEFHVMNLYVGLLYPQWCKIAWINVPVDRYIYIYVVYVNIDQYIYNYIEYSLKWWYMI